MSATDWPYTRWEGVAHTAPNGGTVSVQAGGRATAIGPIRLTPSGTAFGPLEITPTKESRVVLEKFEYRSHPKSMMDGLLSGKLPLAGMAAPLVVARDGSPPDVETDRESVSRRDVLKMGVVAMGGAAMASNPVAAGEHELEVASITVSKNEAGFGLRVWDVVEGVLPGSQDYRVLVDGTPLQSFRRELTGAFDASSAATIPRGVTGTLSVRTDASIGFWTDVKSFLSSPDPLEYSVQLAQPASEYEPNTEVVLTEQAIVIEPLREEGADRATMHLGGESIPHRSESSTDAGAYYVTDDGALVYQVGSNAPDGVEVDLNIGVGRFAELKDDYSRR
jgi:hypothetical protein